jgi:hypothetical protein
MALSTADVLFAYVEWCPTEEEDGKSFSDSLLSGLDGLAQQWYLSYDRLSWSVTTRRAVVKFSRWLTAAAARRAISASSGDDVMQIVELLRSVVAPGRWVAERQSRVEAVLPSSSAVVLGWPFPLQADFWFDVRTCTSESR